MGYPKNEDWRDTSVPTIIAFCITIVLALLDAVQYDGASFMAYGAIGGGYVLVLRYRRRLKYAEKELVALSKRLRPLEEAVAGSRVPVRPTD